MNNFLSFKQTTQDAVRYLRKSFSNKAEKLLLLSVGVVFSAF